MARETKITEKDMAVLREGDTTKVQRDKKFGTIRDYSLNHRITLAWDLNEEAKRDHMCRLTVGDNEAIVDAEELMRYLRWV